MVYKFIRSIIKPTSRIILVEPPNSKIPVQKHKKNVMECRDHGTKITQTRHRNVGIEVCKAQVTPAF